MKRSGYLLDVIIVLLVIVAADSNPTFIHIACGVVAVGLIGARIVAALLMMRH